MHSGGLLFLLPLLASAQTISIVAGNGDLALASLQNQCDPTRFEQTSHVFVDSRKTVYVADTRNHRIRRFQADGKADVVAGDGSAPASSCAAFNPVNDGANALAARLYNPSDMVVRPNGNIVIADQQNNRIREVTPAGNITTIAGNGLHSLFSPGVPAIASALDWPTALALDSAGNVLFTEIHSHRVGRINAATGRLEAVVNPNADTRVIAKPMGIAVDRTGGILIADTGNHRVRRAAADGSVTTLAGSGQQSYCGDNGPATAACFDTPMDVKPDSRGNIYIADTGNSRVRRIDSSGTVTTVVGPETLRLPCAIAFDADDNLYITDWQNFRVIKVSAPAIPEGGVVDGARFSLPPAPGGIFSIFGTNLASALSQAAVTPLPVELGGVRVEVNGVAAPLYFVSAGQINAQVPYEAAPGPATLRMNGATAQFTIQAAAPAIFAAVRQGDVVVAYVTGLGAVTPRVATGAAAPFDSLSHADGTVTATIGGEPAKVLFAGLAPGFIGLGQVNLQIPSNATNFSLVLEANGQKSEPVEIR